MEPPACIEQAIFRYKGKVIAILTMVAMEEPTGFEPAFSTSDYRSTHPQCERVTTP